MTTLAQGVSRKINRVIGLDIDSDNVRSALATLPSVEPQSGNSKAALKSYMESGLLQSNVAFSQQWGAFVSVRISRKWVCLAVRSGTSERAAYNIHTQKPCV